MERQPQGPMYQTQSGPVYQTVENRNPWQTGYIKRLPVAGLLAILGAIIGMGACTAILIISNGQPISHWKFQPTVYLAIASTLTNIFLAFALSEGADIAWWKKAGSDRTKVADLHRLWTHAHSFKQALLSGRNFTLVAAACLLATIAQVNSPLLQRASTVYLQPDVTVDTKISFRAVSAIPFGFTGYTSGRGYSPALFTTNYTKVVQTWNNNQSISIQNSGCAGICSAKVKALGLSVRCNRTAVPFDLNPSLTSNGTFDPTTVQGVEVFRSSFGWGTLGGNITLRIVHKETSSCKGDLIAEDCALTPAYMQYPVIIDGNKSTISLDPKYTIWDDMVDHQIPFNPDTIWGPSTFGGYYLALQNKWFSNATMRFTGAVPYTILTQGNAALQYAVTTDNNSPYANCTTAFSSSLNDTLNSARELMFRTSIAAANSSTPLQIVDASDSQTRAVYRSNYYYLGGALAITFIATITILGIFQGYAQLGRHPTMSPIEVAKAFNAPMLQSHDGNAEADDLIRDVGERSVKYGATNEGGPPQSMFGTPPMMQEYKPYNSQYNPHVQEVNPNARRRLVMGDENAVQKPASGETFAG